LMSSFAETGEQIEISEEAKAIESAIVAKGEEIRSLKAIKPAPPSLKEDLAPLIQELTQLKLQFKQLAGKEYGAAPAENKKKESTPQVQKESEGPSKTELNKLKRKEQKAAKKAEEREVSGVAVPTSTKSVATDLGGEDDSRLSSFYGDSPMVRSEFMTEKVYVQIKQLNESMVGQGQRVWLRARLATSRAVGKGIFVLLRQTIFTVQGVMFQDENVSKSMVKYAAAISLESVVDVQVSVTVPSTPIQSATVKMLELSIHEIHVVSRAMELPFQVEDAGRSEADAQSSGLPVVNQDTALNFRWIDTRTPASQAIFRVQSGVCQLFREFLTARDFVEIHTPKLIGGASEGGANVFTLKYFKEPACLAQSPQFYKQMTAACGGFERVFEIGPVFRAEDSNTHRHLCEFTGLDFEMAIYEHYYEVLEVMGELFTFIFDGIRDRFEHELMLISQQFPVEPIKYLRPSLRITFQEGITMLKEAGVEASYDEDISTPQEKALGKLVKEKYGTDFYMMDKYPLAARPFYTMPDPQDPKLSNSYDVFIRCVCDSTFVSFHLMSASFCASCFQ